ncbi:YmfQ family protein [Clostridium sp. AWRP]|uniref:YmfQ family protein n=1 Tax=Clostridium sp. AWRP TaxID=2212991 RepID=UPI000FD904C7|nr:YmfQ family protein [Clostridium sp. AWRP]AZV57919.1 DUF2313 domain-containing protein [Clostridium sp. AWRP]
MYGNNLYGTIEYAEDNISDEEIKPYIPDLMKYLPPWYYNTSIMNKIQNSIGKEMGSAKYNQQDLLKQFFIDTATWGLGIIWEKPLKIAIDLNKSCEDRREIIKAKMRGSGTTTAQMIKNTAEAFSGGECNVIFHPEGYYFTIQFVGIKGIPKNMEVFKKMLEDIKPAHLGYDFKYTYTVWNFLKNKGLTVNQAKSNTWDSLKVYDG